MLQWRFPNQRYDAPEEMVADVNLSPLLVYGNQTKVVEMRKGHSSELGCAGRYHIAWGLLKGYRGTDEGDSGYDWSCGCFLAASEGLS